MSNSKRNTAKRISVFNHKGGVGKTTLTFNIASALAAKNKKVLLVDSDPQCNLTAYLIEDTFVDDLLDKSDSANGQTLWSAVKPIVDATGPLHRIKPFDLLSETQLLPGDIRLSDFETELNDFWSQCFQRKRRGFNGTMALSYLVNLICETYKIDFVFYDSGPNIGALNRVILLDCDYFIVPASYDLFSVRALKTLGRTLSEWTTSWKTVHELAPEDEYLLPGKPKFLGYVPQNFNVYRGQVSSGPAKYAAPLDRGIETNIVGVLKSLDLVAAKNNYKLGEVKDFGALITASQLTGLPMWEVKAGSSEQRADARTSFFSIASRILELTS